MMLLQIKLLCILLLVICLDKSLEVIKINDITIKSFLKRVLVNSLIFIISLMCILDFNRIESDAAWNTSAKDFIAQKGEQTAYFDEHAFWFAQYGINPTTGIYYQTLGWNVSVYLNNNWYTVGFKTRSTNRQVDEGTYGTPYLYTLWRIGFDEIVDRLESKYPSVNFSSLRNKNEPSTFYFDAIVRVHDGSKGWTGDINDYGNALSSGDRVFTNLDGLYNSKGSVWGPKTEYDSNRNLTIYGTMMRLFDISKEIQGSQKPTPPLPSVAGFLVEPGRAGWPYATTHYHVNGSNDYWVNLKDPFSVYIESSINQRHGSPAYNHAALVLNGDIKNNLASAGFWKGLNVNGAGNYFYNYFTDYDNTKFSYSNTNSRNYLFTTFIMKAKNDNQDFQLGYIAAANGESTEWSYIDQWLKTDGSPPQTDFAPAHNLKDVDNLSILQQNIFDTRSGVKESTVRAYVYMSGEGKGNPITLNRVNQYLDYGADVNLNSHLGEKFGDVVIEVWASDNVGNDGMVSTTTVKRTPSRPKNHTILIKDYKYEDATTKWVRLNENFSVFNSADAFRGGINGFDMIYDLSKAAPNTDVYLNAWIFNGGMTYNSIRTGFGALSNTQPLVSTEIDSVYSNYNKCVNSIANSMSINGCKFLVWGRVNYNDGGKNEVTEWVRDPKLLGIDGIGPSINWTSNGSSILIKMEDGESGFNRAEIDVNGHKTPYSTPEVTIPVSTSTITITAYDNVGNSNTVTISPGGWEGEYIKTYVTKVGGKKVLKYTVDAEVYEYYSVDEGSYGSDGKWNPCWVTYRRQVPLTFKADSSKYLFGRGISISRTNVIHYQNLIEDLYNQSYGPTLSYKNNNSTYASVVWEHIEDIEDEVNLVLYKRSGVWDSVRKYFCSGRKDYKWVLYQTADRYGNPINKTLVGKGTVVGDAKGASVDMSSYKTGSYEIEVTMYDYNGNPSGTSVYKFNHVQPHIDTDVSDLFLKVTAVKDLNWETMTYPIRYNSLEFPLGKNKLSQNGEGIKLGYVVNYSIENMIKHSLSDYSATYTLLGENGELLSATSNGKPLKDSDTRDGTGYLYQPSSQIIPSDEPSPDSTNNGFSKRLFFKHFIPADAEFYKTDGSVYRGKVTVRVKIYLKEIGTDGIIGENNYTVDLYTIDTSDSAYSDLNINKQR